MEVKGEQARKSDVMVLAAVAKVTNGETNK
jgi:hypothetical protein